MNYSITKAIEAFRRPSAESVTETFKETRGKFVITHRETEIRYFKRTSITEAIHIRLQKVFNPEKVFLSPFDYGEYHSVQRITEKLIDGELHEVSREYRAAPKYKRFSWSEDK